MVGVGGRSKACATCYRRRVKCDETRPKCKRCIKASLDCGGYKPMTIIQYGKAQEQSLTHPSLPADPLLYPTWSAPPGEIPDALRAARLELGYEVPPAIDSVFVNYTLSNLLSARNQQHVITGVERDLSDMSFLALATFFFGNEHKEQRLIEYGLQRYGKVLKKLNLALGDAKRRQTFDVLEAVVLMAMFEYLMSERPDGWIAHSLGLERLFDVRGPESFVPRAERTILERSRLSIIFAHLVLRKPTILARLEWQSIPWGPDPSHKHLIEHLIDVMAGCPQLLALEDKMKAAQDGVTRDIHMQSLWKQAGRLKEQLDDWKRHWDISEPNCRHEKPIQTNTGEAAREGAGGHPLHLFKYVYNSLYHANAVTLYNATLILIGGMLRSSGVAAGLVDEQMAAEHDAQQHEAGIDIARSADHCIQIARGGLGSFYILFPLRMAWAVGTRLDPVLKSTTEAMLHRIQFGEAGHWAIAGYILGI